METSLIFLSFYFCIYAKRDYKNFSLIERSVLRIYVYEMDMNVLSFFLYECTFKCRNPTLIFQIE